MAIRVVGQNAKSCHAPTSTSAGTVKMTPAAKLSPVEAIVCAMLFSRMVPVRKTPRSIAVLTTAAGIDALTVIPAYKPRYTFAAPSTTARTRPSTIARSVDSAGI